MTYSERSAQLAVDSSISALVLMGAPDDVEFIQLRPKRADANKLAELKARWPGRGLRAVGVIGLVGTAPRYVLKEPLATEEVSALADAFLAYLHALFCDGFAAQEESAEVAELERWYALQDTRTEA
jgi:hypothetical protein